MPVRILEKNYWVRSFSVGRMIIYEDTKNCFYLTHFADAFFNGI